MTDAREKPAAGQRRDYAILISLAMREEAEVLASALRAEGIDAFAGNGQHVNTDWHLTQAMGGVQVLVPGDRIEEAKEIIRERVQAAAEEADDQFDHEPATRHDRWKLWVVLAYMFGAPAMVVFVLQWLLVGLAPAAPEPELPPEPAPSYFAAPDNLTEAEQRSILRDYCRDRPDHTVISREEGMGYITPCEDVLRMR